MQIIRHRRNTAQELSETPVRFGVEVDIRSYGDQLVIHHDPFIKGEDFARWLGGFRHQTLILNVKEEGLEDRLLTLVRAERIENFFFLDQSFPFLIKTINGGERRCAVRVSEFESVETAMSLAGKIDWIWVDCFTRLAMTEADAKELKKAGFKLCLVSPELQGRASLRDIEDFQALLVDRAIDAEAVCTKMPELWE
jgi:hypothetical protein